MHTKFWLGNHNGGDHSDSDIDGEVLEWILTFDGQMTP